MGTAKDILIDKMYELQEENERLKKRMGELFKERDELYDKYVHKIPQHFDENMLADGNGRG